LVLKALNAKREGRGTQTIGGWVPKRFGSSFALTSDISTWEQHGDPVAAAGTGILFELGFGYFCGLLTRIRQERDPPTKHLEEDLARRKVEGW